LYTSIATQPPQAAEQQCARFVGLVVVGVVVGKCVEVSIIRSSKH